MAAKVKETQRQNLHIPTDIYYRLLAQSARQMTPHTTLIYMLLDYGVELLEGGDSELTGRIQNRFTESRS